MSKIQDSIKQGAINSANLPDMQKSTSGFYNKKIEKVGVRGIKAYIPIQISQEISQDVLATFSSYCMLDADTKGINMSRIARTINASLEQSKSKKQKYLNLKSIVEALVDAHKSSDVYLKCKFQILLDYIVPMSGIQSKEPFDIIMESVYKSGEYKNYLTVKSTEMSLCPCSKEMSLLKNNLSEEEKNIIASLPQSLQDKLGKAGFGAHNQKSEISITVEIKDAPNQYIIDDLISIIKTSSSCPTLSVLKREDEKFVTEVSYLGGFYDDNKEFKPVEGTGAKFVEDISRDCALKLDSSMLDKKINDYLIVVNNDESIHSGDIKATSILTAGRDLR